MNVITPLSKPKVSFGYLEYGDVFTSDKENDDVFIRLAIRIDIKDRQGINAVRVVDGRLVHFDFEDMVTKYPDATLTLVKISMKTKHPAYRRFAVELLEAVRPPELSQSDCADPEWRDGYERAASYITNAISELNQP